MNPFTGMRFCGYPINRAAAFAVRRDRAAVQRIMEGPSAQFLLISGKQVKVTPLSPVRLAWQSLQQVHSVCPLSDQNSIYMGPIAADHGEPMEIFAADVASSSAASDGTWVTGREFMLSDASDAEVSMAGLALGMFGWHESALYDGRVGVRTESVEGGMKRKADGAPGKLYPRTDPVAIGLISSPDGTKCLLGRSKHYPKGMYTCLSGFVEHCESVEECLAREAMEEVGVNLKDISLVASQPWPIGRAGSCELMLACRATACSDELAVNRAEVEDARWFEKKEVQEMVERSTYDYYAAPSGQLFVPPPFGVAYHLIKQFAYA